MLHLDLRRHVLLIMVALLFAASACAQDASKPQAFQGLPVRSKLADAAIERKVDALLKQMTLEEKIGQLVQYSVGTPAGPGTSREDYAELVAKGETGSLYNLDGAAAANHYQHIAMEKSRLHIPLINGLDVIHGYRTEFPVPLGMASTWDPEIVEKAARIAAVEASAAGVRWTFSPMVDIARDPRWGRMIEGAGEDPYLGSVMARAYVRGYQGTTLSAPDSIAACAKHFVGYGAAEGGRDYNTTEISEHTLREVYLPPFYAALDEGGATVMSAFSVLNGVPEAANPFTLTEILRKEWHFPGIADSDFGAVGELMAHGVANDGEMAAYRAFSAGLDMDMESDVYHQNLAKLVKAGKISERQIDESVRHVLRVKFALGLFEKPYTDESREKHGPLAQENLDVARAAAEQSMVLLRNEESHSRRSLPLSAQEQTVALIGPFADNAGEMLGSWGGHSQASDVVTLKSALTQRLGADRVKYAKGGDFLTASDEEMNAAVETARSADVAIVTVGEEAGTMTGEAASRAHLNLPGRQEELLEKVSATGKPVVLVVFSGRPLTLPWAFAHVPAVIAAWYPGIQAGPALARILYGEAVPSGRLVVSWPRAVGQIPNYYNALSTGRPVGKVDLTRPPTPGNTGEKYVSRYIDETNAPQFPFGYGLSYTDFRYGAPEASTRKLSAKALAQDLRSRPADARTVMKVSADVTNTGKVMATEVVQVYVGLRGTSAAEPVRALKGFQRVELAAGETKKVTFALTPEAFALWNIQNEYTVEACKARVWVSADSAQGSPVEVEIGE
ncbi:MAG: beta-glucosidase BglX [Candidatus Acidiferrum sp.]